MKFKSKFITLSMAITILIASACYSIVMNSEKIKAADIENSVDYRLEKEAMKYVAKEDIDSTTGKLKDGVIYQVGGEGRYLTSNGFVEYAVNQSNMGMASVVTNKPIITVLPDDTGRTTLFTNNFILNFDVSYDESNVYVETKRNVLVSETFEETSHYETRGRLVWKSYKKKIWFVWVTIWYLEYETYQEQVIVRTPHQVFQEEKSTSLKINLSEDTNLISRVVGKIVDKRLPQVRTLSVNYGIPVAIVLLDTIVTAAKTIFLQLLSIVSEFIPVLDEVKTGYETIFGKDLFTGEKIGLFWRIFGGLTLAVGLVTAIFTFGASMAVADAAGDAAQVTKKTTKLGEAVAELPDTVHDTSKLLDSTTDLVKSGDSITDTGKMIGNVKIKNAKLDSATTFGQNQFKRGFQIDEFAGNIKNTANAKDGVVGLGRTAKTFDLLDTSSDALVSVKSLDTGAQTYQDANKFRRTIEKYIDVADFSKVDDIYNGTNEAAKGLRKGRDFTKTGLDLYIPNSGLTSMQQDIIEQISKNLPDNFIFNIIKLS